MGTIEIPKEPVDEAAAIFLQIDPEVQKLGTFFIIKYLKEIEPTTWDRLTSKTLNKIEKEFKDTGDIEKMKSALKSWLIDWQSVHKRINNDHTQKDLARIHQLQKKLKINSYDYRNILMQEAGKQTSANMRYFEIKLAERGLNLFAQGKLIVTPWDKK